MDGPDGGAAGDAERRRSLKREANRRSARASRQRKKATLEALNAAHEGLLAAESVLACHPDAVIATDDAGTVAYANAAALDALDADGGVAPVPFLDLLDPASGDALRGALDAAGEGAGAGAGAPLPAPLAFRGGYGAVPLDVRLDARRGRGGARANRRGPAVVCAGRAPRAGGGAPPPPPPPLPGDRGE